MQLMQKYGICHWYHAGDRKPSENNRKNIWNRRYIGGMCPLLSVAHWGVSKLLWGVGLYAGRRGGKLPGVCKLFWGGGGVGQGSCCGGRGGKLLGQSRAQLMPVDMEQHSKGALLSSPPSSMLPGVTTSLACSLTY